MTTPPHDPLPAVPLKADAPVRTTFGTIASLVTAAVAVSLLWATLRADLNVASRVNAEQTAVIAGLDERLRKIEATQASIDGMWSDVRAVRALMEGSAGTAGNGLRGASRD